MGQYVGMMIKAVVLSSENCSDESLITVESNTNWLTYEVQEQSR